MIELAEIGNISGIYFTSILIIYLIIAELSSEKVKKTMLPFLILLVAIFIIIAALSVYTQLQK